MYLYGLEPRLDNAESVRDKVSRIYRFGDSRSRRFQLSNSERISPLAGETFHKLVSKPMYI